jgi:hypothetical protein
MDKVYFTVNGVLVDPWGNPIELPKKVEEPKPQEKGKK